MRFYANAYVSGLYSVPTAGDHIACKTGHIDSLTNLKVFFR